MAGAGRWIVVCTQPRRHLAAKMVNRRRSGAAEEVEEGVAALLQVSSKGRGLISSGDKSPPTLTHSIVPTSVPSHVFAKRSFPGTEEFIPLEEEGSPPDESGVGKQGRENMDEYEGRQKRRRVCLSITARRGRGRKAHPSLGLHPLKSLTHFGLAVFEARKT